MSRETSQATRTYRRHRRTERSEGRGFNPAVKAAKETFHPDAAASSRSRRDICCSVDFKSIFAGSKKSGGQKLPDRRLHKLHLPSALSAPLPRAARKSTANQTPASP